MQSRASKKDLGLELGLALEKSIKLRSQSNQTENTAGFTLTTCKNILILFTDFILYFIFSYTSEF